MKLRISIARPKESNRKTRELKRISYRSYFSGMERVCGLKKKYIVFSFFRWINPIVRLGYQRNLEMEDLYRVKPGDQSDYLGLTLQRYFIIL